MQLDNNQLIVESAQAIPELHDQFAHEGYNLYLVGGIVRDALLGEQLHEHTDIDLTTEAHPGAIQYLLQDWADEVWAQGEKFGTIAALKNNRSVEITTHRSESYDAHSRKPQVQFSDDVYEDLSRRDFTINAMAVDLYDYELLDPHGGLLDLNDSILRTPLDPAETFADDPLRMLRAGRFASKYNLDCATNLIDAMGAHSDRIKIVSGERIHQEMRKLLELESPESGLMILFETGLLGRILPGVTATDVLRISDTSPELGYLSRLAVLVHSRREPDYVTALAGMWKLSTAERQHLLNSLTAAWALEAEYPADLPSLRAWMIKHQRHIEEGINVAAKVHPIVDLRNRVADLQIEEPDLGTDVMSGDQIMQLLALRPGPEVGECKKYLLELQIQHGPITIAEARSQLQHWWAGRDDPTNVAVEPLTAATPQPCSAKTQLGNPCKNMLKPGTRRCPAGHKRL